MFWVTKYALSGGIMAVEGEVSTKYPDMLSFGLSRYVHKPFWHATEAEAIEHAEKLRIAKIASLKKQIEKLEKKRF